jgi:hypothetical protein
MKKTINGLLLALTVCAGNAYGADWEDDRTMKGIMSDTLNDLDGPSQSVEAANEALKASNDRSEALGLLVNLLKSQGIDTTSKTPDEIKQMAQNQIKTLDQKIKSKTTQTTSSTTKSPETKKPAPTPSQHSSADRHGSRANY